MVQIELKPLNERARIPRRMTTHAAGYDLYTSIEKEIVLQPGEAKLIPTGISIGIPEGYEAQIRPRSGLALKHSIGILNAPGTIDADYRGEIGVILFNFGKEPYTIQPDSRIAQMIISRCETADFLIVDDLSETERGADGFGHTNI